MLCVKVGQTETTALFNHRSAAFECASATFERMYVLLI